MLALYKFNSPLGLHCSREKHLSEAPPDFKNNGGADLSGRSREFIDGLFNYALVFLGILSAAELQYAARVLPGASDFALMFRVSVLPFTILVPTWLAKEVLKEEMPRRLKMFLTEFCWELWSFTLVLCMVLLYALETSSLTWIVVGGFSSFGLSLVLVYAITRGYASAYRDGPYGDMVEFYQRRRFRVLRLIPFAAAYLLVYLIIL
jgi:hypothetical protein